MEDLNKMKVVDKNRPVAVITGASRGIGKATAEYFCEKGYNVIVNYARSEESAIAICQKLGESAFPIKADVRNSAEIKAMFEKAYDLFGRIDVLVNNAGIARQKVLSDVSDEDIDELLSVDLCGVIKCSREVLPYMLKTHCGSIVNISSMWGVCGGSCETVYSAAKAGVIGFTKAFAKEAGLSGIRVNCIAPGVINTEMNSALTKETLDSLAEETPLCRIGDAVDVAKAIYFLASNDASFITGQVLCVDGGITL